jgi:hypothetical protein
LQSDSLGKTRGTRLAGKSLGDASTFEEASFLAIQNEGQCRREAARVFVVEGFWIQTD